MAYYSGPQLTGAAIGQYCFVEIVQADTPDTLQALTSDTGTCLGVTTVALASGQRAYGIETSEDVDVLIQLAAGVAAVADDYLTASTAGAAKLAATGDVVMAKALEPGSGTAGIVRCRLLRTTNLLP
jgi:hypothetical protein